MTELEFLQKLRNYNIRAFCGVVGTVGAIFAWMGLLQLPGLSGPLWCFPIILILATGFGLTDKICNKFAIQCPACAHSLSRAQKQVIVTRCCDSCSHQIIVDGQPRRIETYRRLNRIQSNAVLARLLWCWPALFGVFALCAWCDPSGIRK